MGPTFLSDYQIERGKVLGVRTIAESRVIAGTGGAQTIIWDALTSSRWPVLVRVKNLSATEPLYVSEDIRDANNIPVCSAASFTDILAYDTIGTDKGFGAADEWQKNRPSCIAIFGTNAYRAVIVIRYVDEV